ncbi:MAG: DUF4037 domain-containing protein [Deltaproteobacteria bacterium]|nr:DUF4037 domain-containing protein [Deltaproteobacteria bacterium]
MREMKPEKEFVNGVQLCQTFYDQIVWPLLSREGFSNLMHSSGLLDAGSEVFGLDDVRSTDHHWGPRVLIFLNDTDHEKHAADLKSVLGKKLPFEFMGYSTNFGQPDEIGVQLLQPTAKRPINHRVQFFKVTSFFRHWLKNFDPTSKEITLEHWRSLPQQVLFAIRNGKLFRDDLNVESIRKKLWFYPKPIWIERLIHEWSKIEEEQAFVGRTGEVNDEIGSRVITARLVTSLMKIAFLLEREYYPYSKWFGTAFSRLETAEQLEPHIMGALKAKDWRGREQSLCNCYSVVIQRQNSIEGLPSVKLDISHFYNRPFRVPHAERIVETLRKEVSENI